MAQLFPTLQTVERLRDPPTNGERALLEYLRIHLRDEYEVYFQPYFNGLRPDIVVMKKGWGVIIIEVKDWDLSAYTVDETNKWKLRRNNVALMSPHQQVFLYKKSMFDLHIEGLAEARVQNFGIYNILKPFVYFHGSSKYEIDDIFRAAESAVRRGKDQLNEERSSGKISFEDYEKQWEYLDRKEGNIRRDRGMTLHEKSLSKIQDALRSSKVFTPEIYSKFKRYLQPPLHTKDQGKLIKYGQKQMRLTQSAPGLSKIKGVAGSGKTTVLAKRAVNAHIRHQRRVLIMTYNLTLRNYIHDRISEVREEFSWGNFDIINYHSFIMDQYRKVGGDPDKYGGDLDKLFSDENLFDAAEEQIRKYETILIDEIQDFEVPWIKIMRKFFLAEGGEMVLYGDESQNIYNRPLALLNHQLRGFGTWEELRVSYRSSSNSPLTQLISDFQSTFLASKYDTDLIEGHDSPSEQLSLDIQENDVLEYAHLGTNSDCSKLAENIYTFMQAHNIQPNDICIVGGEIAPLRQLEEAYKARTGEETNTTFETQDVYERVLDEVDSASLPRDVRKKEIDDKLEPIRRSKKFHFWQNRGTLKLSTIHSYKGLEARNIVYLMSSNDTDEIVYTAITRSKNNLLAYFSPGHKYASFLEQRLRPLSQI